MAKRAAHFLLTPALAYSPPNDAIVSALLELGYEVDLFAPGGDFPTDRYGPRVMAHAAEYDRHWILKNAFSPRWRRYRLFSGTAEDPMAVVGVLSLLHGRRSFALADEIMSEGYSGDRSKYWKMLCRWAMRRSRFTIVNEALRIPLQRGYAGLPRCQPVIIYPGCFKDTPAPGDRRSLRAGWGIPSEGLVVTASGGFNATVGAPWLAKALEARKDIYAVLQLLAVHPATRHLLAHCPGRERMYIEKRRLEWREAWSSMAGVDIGIAIYHYHPPQFLRMGTSSNRLCMFLSMGVPVIASRQPSFEFIERYRCGVLVETEQQFIDAIGYIKERLPEMRANAKRCAREYIDAQGKYRTLVAALAALDRGRDTI